MNVVATIGASALLTALATSLFAIVASAYGHRRGSSAAMHAGRRAIIATAALITLAAVTLAYALLTNDFSIAHVATVSSTNMRPWMKWASFYSGQPGSLLFWTWAMSLFFAAFVRITVPKIPWGAPHAVAISGAVLAAFIGALVFMASPFEVSTVTPLDGAGLNPLLVDSGMLIHPPLLLAGLVSTAIPFTLGAAALMAGKLDTAWLRQARRWALLSFLVLAAGNFLGAWWAYTVLGWGGYWGWDPVENSAILPLFPMTAFLHALVVQERRGMLKSWNLVLVIGAFALAVFGTFNVRSGLVASVHSFAQSDVGPYFLALLGILVLGSLLLLVWRWPRMSAEYEFESLASRESGLILNSYVLIAIALVVIGGTLFPVFSELFRGVRITVGPPFYDQAIGPLWIAMLALILFGTVLPWRRASGRMMARRFRGPLSVLLAAAVVLSTLGMRDPFALATTAVAVALLYATLREYAIGVRGLRRATGRNWLSALSALFERDRRRYGGYLVHVGVAVIAITVVSSNVYQQQVRATLAPGESVEIGRYTLQYDGPRVRRPGVNGIEREDVAQVTVLQGGEVTAVLSPGRRNFTNFPNQPVALVALESNLREDLYLFVQGFAEDGTVELQAFVNPLIIWLWFGGAIFIAGGLLAFAPAAAPSRETVDAPTGATQQA